MDLNELLVFVRVVQAGSIRSAAELLGMPKSTVSRKLIELEERLEARLVQRTTRKLGLTDIGRIYYDYGVRIVAEVENAERAVRSQHETPRGLLRVTAPLNLALFGPVLSDYLKRYPDVRLELSADARVVDLIEERFDVGIRAGRLEDSSLIAKTLASIESLLVATPTYLKKRGRPKVPSDLQKHACLLFGKSAKLTLVRDGRAEEIALNPRLLVTDYDVLEMALTGGLGIAVMPMFRCEEAIRADHLERVLPNWRPPSTPLSLVYPSTRHLSPTVRSFIDHVQERMPPLSGDCPPAPRPCGSCRLGSRRTRRWTRGPSASSRSERSHGGSTERATIPRCRR